MPVTLPRPDDQYPDSHSGSGAVTGCSENADVLMTSILEEHFNDLSGFALRLCERPDVAADVVQQTCLKAWAARSTYDTSLPARPWLFRILRNEFLQIVRRPTPFTNVDDAVFEADPANDFHRLAPVDSLALWQSLSMLPDDQRHAVTLVVAMGFSYDEAGEVCSCSAGTIKSRVNRGKLKIREALRNEESGTFQS